MTNAGGESCPENSAGTFFSSSNSIPKKKRACPATVFRENYREIARKCGRITYLEAADYAGVTVKTLQKWLCSKKNPLPIRARVGAYRIDLLDLEKYLRRGAR